MNYAQISNQRAPETSDAGPLETKLEVVVIPVSDVDRAKRFYASLGCERGRAPEEVAKDGARLISGPRR